VCLSTSLRDATQIAILEPLARGIPVVSTRVGDAPAYYTAPSLERFCVDPRDTRAAARAILELVSSYERYRRQFAANAHQLRARHRSGAVRLSALLEEAAPAVT
jgi:glycosyltransferase involved in cell wall biosynthesis